MILSTLITLVPGMWMIFLLLLHVTNASSICQDNQGRFDVNGWLAEDTESVRFLPSAPSCTTLWGGLLTNFGFRHRSSYDLYESGWNGILGSIVELLRDEETGQLRTGMSLARLLNAIQLAGRDAGGQLLPTFTTKHGVGPTPMSGHVMATIHGRRVSMPGIFA